MFGAMITIKRPTQEYSIPADHGSLVTKITIEDDGCHLRQNAVVSILETAVPQLYPPIIVLEI